MRKLLLKFRKKKDYLHGKKERKQFLLFRYSNDFSTLFLHFSKVIKLFLLLSFLNSSTLLCFFHSCSLKSHVLYVSNSQFYVILPFLIIHTLIFFDIMTEKIRLKIEKQQWRNKHPHSKMKFIYLHKCKKKLLTIK